MAFQYLPLHQNGIRLLKPVPDAVQTLAFEMIYVSSNSKPHYSALSYTWGQPSEPLNQNGEPLAAWQILVNGKAFQVRKSLFESLLRMHSSALVTQHLWIDAICINQADQDERSVQVRRMREIYESAANVLVWLGIPDDAENNRLAFEKMKFFYNDRMSYIGKSHLWPPSRWFFGVDSVSQDQERYADRLTTLVNTDRLFFDRPGSRTHKAWLGIVSMWSKPWWTRTWIYQEATVPETRTYVVLFGANVLKPQGKVRFICGDQDIGWAELESTGIVASVLAITGTMAFGSACRSYELLAMFRHMRFMTVELPFLDLLSAFQDTHCEDPKDKVYAALCLASSDIREHMIPNYKKTVVDVYKDVARYYINLPGHHLDFLGHTFCQDSQCIVEGKSKEGRFVLPTWVPNFSEKANIVPLPKALYQREVRGQATASTKRFYEQLMMTVVGPAYSGPLGPLNSAKAEIYIDDQRNTLHVRGVRVDKIQDLALGVDSEFSIPANTLEKQRDWARESRNMYFTGETFDDVVSRTLVNDIVFDDSGRPYKRGGKFFRAGFEAAWLRMRDSGNISPMSNFLSTCKGHTSRMLGYTIKKYIVHVPRTARKDDEVWALMGGQVLFVLRPTNQQKSEFRYIGECYAHGLMDGALLQSIDIKKAMRYICLV